MLFSSWFGMINNTLKYPHFQLHVSGFLFPAKSDTTLILLFSRIKEEFCKFFLYHINLPCSAEKYCPSRPKAWEHDVEQAIAKNHNHELLSG